MKTDDIEFELRAGVPMQPQLHELAAAAVRDFRSELVALLDALTRIEQLLVLLREHGAGRANDTYFLEG